ncbi:hypothetical protein F4823DRAFT_575229, partial [Ustulina deusta]
MNWSRSHWVIAKMIFSIACFFRVSINSLAAARLSSLDHLHDDTLSVIALDKSLIFGRLSSVPLERVIELSILDFSCSDTALSAPSLARYWFNCSRSEALASITLKGCRQADIADCI